VGGELPTPAVHHV
jgi:hypothetical protein